MAKWARKNADACQFKHWHVSQRTGQNIAGKRVKGSVDMWYNEIKDFNHETRECNAGAVCGHYTQVL